MLHCMYSPRQASCPTEFMWSAVFLYVRSCYAASSCKLQKVSPTFLMRCAAQTACFNCQWNAKALTAYGQGADVQSAEGQQMHTTCGGAGYIECTYSRGAAAARQPGDASRQSSAQGSMVSARQHADTHTGTPEAQRSGSDTRRQPEAYM